MFLYLEVINLSKNSSRRSVLIPPLSYSSHRLIDESLAQSNVNDIDKYDMNERKQILIDGISDTHLSIYATSLLVEKTELLLDKNKCKKTYFTTFNEYIRKLNDCLQSNSFRIYSVD